MEQWREIKQVASAAIGANGGTITHHHGVGVDHVPGLEREVGPVGIEALRAVKERFDPEGILNPGKLLPPGPEPEEEPFGEDSEGQSEMTPYAEGHED